MHTLSSNTHNISFLSWPRRQSYAPRIPRPGLECSCSAPKTNRRPGPWSTNCDNMFQRQENDPSRKMTISWINWHLH